MLRFSTCLKTWLLSCRPVRASPSLLLKKANKSNTFCTDNRKVNSVLKPDAYPLLQIDNCIDQDRELLITSSQCFTDHNPLTNALCLHTAQTTVWYIGCCIYTRTHLHSHTSKPWRILWLICLEYTAPDCLAGLVGVMVDWAHWFCWGLSDRKAGIGMVEYKEYGLGISNMYYVVTL